VASGGAQDVNAIFGYKGLAHMFHQGGSGWMHFISKDYVSWRPLPTIIPPGGWDGSLTVRTRPASSKKKFKKIPLFRPPTAYGA